MGDALYMSVCMKGTILGTPPGQKQMEQGSRPPPAVVMPVSALALLWVFHSQSSSTTMKELLIANEKLNF